MDTTTEPTPVTRTPVRLVPLLLVLLAASAAAAVPLAALQPAVDPQERVVTLTQFSTAVGTALVWALWRHRLPFPGLRPRTWAPAATALVGAPAAFLLIGTLSRVTGLGQWPGAGFDDPPGWLVLVLGAQLLGAAGEEVAWRGVVQPALETRLDVLPAAVVTGALFGVGHFPLPGAGVLVHLCFVLSAIALSIVLADVTAGRRRAGRVLVGTLGHWSVNVTIWWGFDGGDGTPAWTVFTVVALGALAVVTSSVRRRRTSRAPRRGTPPWRPPWR